MLVVVEAKFRFANRSHPTKRNTQTAIVTIHKPTSPADPEPTFDCTGMPQPSQFDVDEDGRLVSYTIYEQEAFKRTNWKGYAEHITKWRKWYERKNSPVPVAMEPKSQSTSVTRDKPTSDIGPCLSGTLSLAATCRDCENPAKHYQAVESDGLPLSKR